MTSPLDDTPATPTESSPAAEALAPPTPPSTAGPSTDSQPPLNKGGADSSSWRLYRGRNRVIGGVCDGVANASGLDLALVRLAFVLTGLIGFGAVAYLIMWAVVDEVPDGATPRQAPSPRKQQIQWAVGGSAGFAALVILTGGSPNGRFPGLRFGLILVAIGLVVILSRRRSSQGSAPSTPLPPPTVASGSSAATDSSVVESHTTSPSRSAWSITAGVIGWLTVVAAVFTVLGIMFADDAGVLEIPWSGLLLVLAALTVVNLAVWSSISRRVWPIMVSLILVLGVGIATVNVSYVNGPVGLRTVVVESTDEIDPVYEMAIGSQTIDLSRIDRIPDNGGIRITQGIGETIIVVPDDLGIYAMGKIKAGQIRLFDKAVSGWQRNLTVESGDRDPKLVLSIEIGYGQVDVCRASDAIWIDGGLSCDGRFLPHGGRERGGHTF